MAKPYAFVFYTSFPFNSQCYTLKARMVSIVFCDHEDANENIFGTYS